MRHTPVVPLHESFGAEGVHLKLETLQPVGSFKLRGVYHAVARMTDEQRARGLQTVSAGNTAQALAWSGRRFGVPARSLMPDSAPRTKIEAVRAYGGEPVLVPVDEVFAYLREHRWENEPYAFVHPWTNTDVMTGHGSLGLELVEDVPELDAVYVPVGGGGLVAGVGSAVQGAPAPASAWSRWSPRAVPRSMRASRRARRVRWTASTICDGVAVPYITQEMYPLLAEIVDRVRLVSEDGVRETVRRLALDANVVAEPSAALAVAAALDEPSGRGRAACLVTGGSIDAEKLVAILRSG